jgi:hypothetical protein
LIPTLADPYHDPAAAAVSYYRWTFEDTSFDGQIGEIIKSFPADPPDELAMVFPEKCKRREPGVGRRNDMIYWGEWSDDISVNPIHEPSTAALALAYQLTGDVDFAARAFQSAATRLMMARRVLRGGREHADMGGAVCSVAAGHGRNWGQGAVTGCYGPLLLGTREVQSEVKPLLNIKNSYGNQSMPDGLLTLVQPPVEGKGWVKFYNMGENPMQFSWQLEGAEWHDLTLQPREVRDV